MEVVNTVNQSSPAPSNPVVLPKPKSVNLISQLFFVIAIANFYSAFVGSALILVLNYKVASIPGILEFEALKAMPHIGLISIPGMIALPLILYAYLRVKSGSLAGWKISIIILSLVFIFQIILGFIVGIYMNSAYQATNIY